MRRDGKQSIFILLFVVLMGVVSMLTNHSALVSNSLALDAFPQLESVEFSNGIYTGAVENSLLTGEGTFEFFSGEIYTGDWKNSHMSGTGTMIFPDIGEYSGSMKESKRNGKGTFRWYSGDVYSGSWENDAISGEGEYIFDDGSVFTGAFYNNRIVSGTLTCVPASDKDREDCIVCVHYENVGLGNPQIAFQTSKGLAYEGDYSSLKDAGKATIKYPSGCVFTGTLQKGQPTFGTFKTVFQNVEDETGLIYVLYTVSKSGKTISFQMKNGLEYKGDYSGLTGDGNAEIRYPSGNTYSGEICSGKRNGTGTYSWNDSNGKLESRYVGSWEQDLMNGAGTYYYSEQQYPCLSGKFSSNQPFGTLAYILEDGSIFETVWVNGECIRIKES